MADWNQIQAAWTHGWKALHAEGLRLYRRAIQANPSKYLETIQGFVAALKDSRASLDRIRASLPSPPATAEDQALLAKAQALEGRYQQLAAGFYADVQPAGAPATGVAPLIVIAGLAVGVAACAWAVVAYEYAVNLREQTSLAEKELNARVTASKEGRALQPSTLPEPASEKAKKGVGMLVLGGLALTAAVVAVPVLFKRGS